MTLTSPRRRRVVNQLAHCPIVSMLELQRYDRGGATVGSRADILGGDRDISGPARISCDDFDTLAHDVSTMS